MGKVCDNIAIYESSIYHPTLRNEFVPEFENLHFKSIRYFEVFSEYFLIFNLIVKF